MSENAERKVTKVLSFLAALYPKFELTRATIKAYTRILADIPGDRLEAAAEDLGSRSTFFPAAAELRRAAFDLQQEADGLPTAYEAWQQVKSQFGGQALDLHPLAARAIEVLGGLQAFGQSELDAEMSWRARFIDAYDTLAARQRRRRQMLPQIAEHVEELEAMPEPTNGENRVEQGLQQLTGALKND